MTFPPAKNAVLANVLSKAISVVVLLCLSLSVFAYRRSLTPLYGTAPTDHHFNKVVWAACIIGSFAPIVPILPAVLAAGILLCLMPNTAYWVAVYTGRMGDPIWGPVATHMAIITPVLGLGVAVVKALQVPVSLAVVCLQCVGEHIICDKILRTLLCMRRCLKAHQPSCTL